MELKPGRKIALAVNRDWYQTVAKHRFLKNEPSADHPTDLLLGEIEDAYGMTGIWVKPHERFSDYPLGSLYIPWGVIVTAMLLGPDDEKKFGF